MWTSRTGLLWARRLRALTCSGLLAVVAVCAAADQADPALAARVRELVAELASPHFDVREGATEALLALGPAAAPCLLAQCDHPDIEVRARVRHVLGQLGFLTPEYEAEVARHLEQFWSGPASERQDALDRAASVSPAARVRIEEALAWPLEAVVGELLPPVRWIRSGADWPGPWVLRTTNPGTRPRFVPPALNRTRVTEQRAALAPPRPGAFAGRYGGRRNVMNRGEFNALRDGTALGPGQAHEVAMRVAKPAADYVGWLTVRGFRDVRAEVGAGTLRVPIGPPGVDAATGAVAADARVLVLPAAGSVDLLSLRLTIAKTTRVGDGAIRFELVLVNLGDASARIDDDWTRYTWVALVPCDPTAACPSRVATAIELTGAPVAKAPEARIPRDLASRASQSCTGVWRDLAPGAYLLLAAYEDPSAPNSGYLVGRAIAQEVEVLVR